MNIKNFKPIKGENIFLRQLTKSDLENLRGWRNDSRNYFFNSDVITPEGQKRWFEEVYSNKPNDHIFIIEDFSHKPVGAISLYDIESEKKQAEYGRLVIAIEERRKGYAEDASIALIKYGFTDLGLEKIVLGVIPTNTGARKLYERLGFRTTSEEENEVRMELNKVDYLK